jgi:simple sugar transport system permease protein
LGGLYGGLVGFLKAKTGAHEVIVTIMLNYIAALFVLWLLKTKTF